MDPQRVQDLKSLILDDRCFREIGAFFGVTKQRAHQLVRNAGLGPFYQEIWRRRVRDKALETVLKAHPERRIFVEAARKRNLEIRCSGKYTMSLEGVRIMFHTPTVLRQIGRRTCYRTSTYTRGVLHVFIFPSGNFLVSPPYQPARAGYMALILADDEKECGRFPANSIIHMIRNRKDYANGAYSYINRSTGKLVTRPTIAA